ncbi:hypothetical protein H632_c5315p0, partial [Helicosporidium sp. ATCC 50920]
DAGLDSIGAVELQAWLEQEFPGIVLGPTVAFDYPTIAALAKYVSEEWQPEDEEDLGDEGDSGEEEEESGEMARAPSGGQALRRASFARAPSASFPRAPSPLDDDPFGFEDDLSPAPSRRQVSSRRPSQPLASQASLGLARRASSRRASIYQQPVRLPGASEENARALQEGREALLVAVRKAVEAMVGLEVADDM